MRRTAVMVAIVVGLIGGGAGIDTAASQTDELMGDVIMAISCDVARAAASERRRAGELELPGRRDIDPDTVVIDHLPIDDTVAQDGERPDLDDFPAPEAVTADDLDDWSLVGLVAVCRERDR